MLPWTHHPGGSVDRERRIRYTQRTIGASMKTKQKLCNAAKQDMTLSRTDSRISERRGFRHRRDPRRQSPEGLSVSANHDSAMKSQRYGQTRCGSQKRSTARSAPSVPFPASIQNWITSRVTLTARFIDPSHAIWPPLQDPRVEPNGWFAVIASSPQAPSAPPAASDRCPDPRSARSVG